MGLTYPHSNNPVVAQGIGSGWILKNDLSKAKWTTDMASGGLLEVCIGQVH
jgi:hypothetical protein